MNSEIDKTIEAQEKARHDWEEDQRFNDKYEAFINEFGRSPTSDEIIDYEPKELQDENE